MPGGAAPELPQAGRGVKALGRVQPGRAEFGIPMRNPDGAPEKQLAVGCGVLKHYLGWTYKLVEFKIPADGKIMFIFFSSSKEL